jgi:hypothetical protein
MTNYFRTQAVFLETFELKNAGNFFFQDFMVDMSQNQAYPDTPVFQVNGKADKETGLVKMVEVLKTLKRGQTIQMDFRIKAKPSDKYPKPFNNLEVTQILLIQSTIILPQASDPTPTRSDENSKAMANFENQAKQPEALPLDEMPVVSVGQEEKF